MTWRYLCPWFRAGADLAKILGIIAVGMPASLLVTAQVTVLIRNAVRTDMEEQPPVKRLPPFTAAHYAGWGAPTGSPAPLSSMVQI